MAIDPWLADQARVAAVHLDAQRLAVDQAHAAFLRAVRALHAAGGSVREIAELLDLSDQRVHQLLDLPARLPGRRPPGCSFCGCEQEQVAKLIAGPDRVAICAACVPLAERAIEQGGSATDQRTSITPAAGRCSFCGTGPSDGGDPLGLATAGADAVICGACLALCDDILAEAGAGP